MGATTATEWEDCLGGFACSSHAAGTNMQRRAESKFVMPAAAVTALLPALRHDYAVLPAGAVLVASYRSLYFDTADLALFHAHRRGRRVRQKVRIRHYPDRRVSFLEIKMRTGDGWTSKPRQQRDYGDNQLAPDDLRFVTAHCAVAASLLPQAWVEYRRVTLLSSRTAERVTVDFDLRLSRGLCQGALPGAAIVEVKQWRLDRNTAVMVALRQSGWRTSGASKYCAGIAFTSPEVRANRLLVGLRRLKAVGTWAS